MKRLSSIILAVLPFLICGGLLWSALFIKPKAIGKSIEPPVIGRRDRLYGFTVLDNGVLWAAGNDGKVIRSEDGGETWAEQKTPVQVNMQDLDAWTPEKAVAVGNQGVVIDTQDGGKTWKEVNAPKSTVANKLIRVRVFPDGEAWAVGEMGAVLRSKDFGVSWERMMKEEDVAWNDVYFFNSRSGLVVGEFGRIKSTTDGGKTWRSVSSPVKNSLMGVYFRDAEHGVAVGMEGVVLKSDDGGKSWSLMPKVTEEHLFAVDGDKNGWVASGDKGIILRSNASGVEWKSSRLSENDLSWHTKVKKKGDDIYLSGNTIGVVRDGKWQIFRGRKRG
ncbi:MAG: YCF48-related protein [Candidatus Deferrimicrobium sp.]